MNHYTTIAKALAFIQEKQASQPTLEEIAAHVKLSPFHLQRLFTTWAGVSPKKFLQYLSVERSKALLRSGKNSLVKTAYHTGLSGTGRLHDLFMKLLLDLS
jgi:AraC family transcriptional regulator of adaptative response/methylated-DNA-[protein]-cysteine methyltransferase